MANQPSITQKRIIRKDPALEVYRWLLEQGLESCHIVFMGDSGDWGYGWVFYRPFVINTPLPTAAVAYSPIPDLKCAGESQRMKAKVCLFPEGRNF